MFPKFSTRARGTKVAEVVPPPHTIKAHGKYDLTIGPHVFSNTAIYEVHYLPETDTSVSHGPTAQCMSFISMLRSIPKYNYSFTTVPFYLPYGRRLSSLHATRQHPLYIRNTCSVCPGRHRITIESNSRKSVACGDQPHCDRRSGEDTWSPYTVNGEHTTIRGLSTLRLRSVRSR